MSVAGWTCKAGATRYRRGFRSTVHGRRNIRSAEMRHEHDATPLLTSNPALQGQVEVFVSFKFHDGEAAFVGGGQHVKHGAVRRGEGGDLRIERTRVQPAVD